MARIPHDAHQRYKLDSCWIKGVWVGHTDQTREHVVVTERGAMRARTIRQLTEGDRLENNAYDDMVALP